MAKFMIEYNQDKQIILRGDVKMKRISAEDIAKVKEIAERNFIESAEIGDKEMVSFEFKGMNIIDPWIDDSGRFDLTDEQAIELYGLENVLGFITETLEKEE